MTGRKTQQKASDFPDTDPKGFVTLENGDTEAKVLPESVEVWTERGWKVVNQPKTEKPTEA